MAVSKPSFVRVADGLWVGSTAAPAASLPSSTSHVLTLNGAAPPSSLPGSKPPASLVLEVEDDPEADLLSLLPEACDFLAEAEATNGQAVVLCSQGCSRSVAAAAAYLMRRNGASVADTLASIKKEHPDADPNEGFLEQLSIWQASGFAPRSRHPAVRAWRVRRAAAERSLTPSGAAPALDPDLLSDPLPEAGAAGGATTRAAATLYRCRACGFVLASDSVVVPAGGGPGASAFAWRKRDAGQKYSTAYGAAGEEGGDGEEAGATGVLERAPSSGPSPPASRLAPSSSSSSTGAVFVEPLRWMRGALEGGAVQGKLHCPSCSARLGGFSWAGLQDPSGRWVVPAFQLHASRLDAVPAATAAGDLEARLSALGVRTPKLLPSLGAGAGGHGGTSGGNARPAMSRPAMSRPAASRPAVRGPEAAGKATEPTNSSLAGEAGAPAPLSVGAAAAQGSSGSSTQTAAASSSTTTQSSSLAAAPSSTTQSSATPSAHAPVSVTSLQALPAQFDYLVLDCDGVMVDSERASCESMRRAIERVSGHLIPGEFPEAYYPVFGMNLRSCLEYYGREYPQVAAAGPVEEVLPRMTEIKERLYAEMTSHGIPAFDGIRELVELARGHGLGVAIASSGNPDKIAHNLRSSGLLGIVPDELTVSAAYVRAGKPAPDVYVEALRRLGCADASRALVLEDAVAGVRSAKAAGCFAVAITNTLPRDVLEDHAGAVVAHASQVADILLTGR